MDLCEIHERKYEQETDSELGAPAHLSSSREGCGTSDIIMRCTKSSQKIVIALDAY